MYRFHWIYKCLERKLVQETQEIKKLCLELEKAGYESIDFTMQHIQEDNWINAAHIIDPNQKLKFQLTVKPYSMSPIYCKMMLQSFENIAPGKIVLGIANGKTELPFDEIETDKATRRLKSNVFAKRLLNFKINNNNFKPEILFYGSSEQTIKNSEEYGNGIMLLLKDFKNNKDLINNLSTKRIMVRVSLCIIENENDFIPQQLHDLEKNNFIFGTREEIKQQLDELIKQGATDFLISDMDNKPDKERIHSFVKDLVDRK